MPQRHRKRRYPGERRRGGTRCARPIPAGETELALDLAELGPVRLRIRDRRGRLALHVLADHPATLDLLRRHADELTGALQEAGLSGASLTWGRAPRPAPTTDAPSPDVPAAASPTPSASTGSPAARQPRRDGDLDLLL
ncbi:MAG: flagellar hook-length control protein FliK [Exiguobacterium profundum]|nr:MAG: flagellar hook-length control protein FliK [Exiguobacterium profundum]